MSAAAVPIRLDHELDASVAKVQAVLAGQSSYDTLGATEQASVRTAWDEQLSAQLETLNLHTLFVAEGHRHAELDAQGRVRILHP